VFIHKNVYVHTGVPYACSVISLSPAKSFQFKEDHEIYEYQKILLTFEESQDLAENVFGTTAVLLEILSRIFQVIVPINHVF